MRGLAASLLGRQALERLAMSPDLATFARELDTTAYRAADGLEVRTPTELERQTRRAAGERLSIIAQWSGDRADALAPLFEDEDRRNLRALVRAIVANVAVEKRTAGLLPTPSLSNPALEALARQPRVADLAALLASWGNPYGTAMLPEAAGTRIDLFALQLAIDRAYATRMLGKAEQVGEPVLGFVRTQLDAENASTALAASSGALGSRTSAQFIDGGKLITRDEFDHLVALPPAEARARLARLVAGTVLAPIAPEHPAGSDEAMLTAQIRELRRTVRLDPLSLGVVLEYVLRLRAELEDLARIIWGITLRVPRRRISAGLVTP
ncbi:MAG TPA: V-type ATPase subunit [Kofleriaceae bacterium]|nr:V-type ATPase subunit [Kofleriaceae bacterium]